MIKRTLVTGLTIILMLALSSCGLLHTLGDEINDLGLKDRIELDEDLHNTIEYVDSDESEQKQVRYRDSLYTLESLGIFTVTDDIFYPNEEDLFLGWTGYRYGRAFFYYSDTADSPVFLYEATGPTVYLHEDYDYKSSVFVLKGTDIEVVFADMFVDFSSSEFAHTNSEIDIELNSKDYSRIRTQIKLSQNNGIWYIHASNYKWQADPDWIHVLEENGIL